MGPFVVVYGSTHLPTCRFLDICTILHFFSRLTSSSSSLPQSCLITTVLTFVPSFFRFCKQYLSNFRSLDLCHSFRERTLLRNRLSLSSTCSVYISFDTFRPPLTIDPRRGLRQHNKYIHYPARKSIDCISHRHLQSAYIYQRCIHLTHSLCSSRLL